MDAQLFMLSFNRRLFDISYCHRLPNISPPTATGYRHPTSGIRYLASCIRHPASCIRFPPIALCLPVSAAILWEPTTFPTARKIPAPAGQAVLPGWHPLKSDRHYPAGCR